MEATLAQSKLKVGSLVRGPDNGKYNITTNRALMRVTEIYGETKMMVEILRHETMPSEVGHTFTVDPKYFRRAHQSKKDAPTAPKALDRSAFTRTAACTMGERRSGTHYADLLGPKGINAGCGHTIDDQASLADVIYAAINFCDAKGIRITSFKKES